MKSLISMAVLAVAFAGPAFATQNHTCQGGHNCNQGGGDTHSNSNADADADANALALQGQQQGQIQGQQQGQQQAAIGVGVGIGQGGNATGGNASVGGVGNGIGNFSPSSSSELNVAKGAFDVDGGNATAFGGQGGDVDAEFKDLVDNTNLNANTAFGGQGGDADSHSASGVFGSGNSDVRNTLNTTDVNVVEGDKLYNNSESNSVALGGYSSADNKNVNTDVNVVEGDKNMNLQGQNTDVSNDNASNATTGDQVTNVQVGGEGAPLTASSQSVEGDSLSIDDHTQTTYRNKSLALALPGATADLGSTASCLESRRGWTFFGAGASGRTRTNEACDADRTDRREFEQCMDLARNFAALGLIDHAVAQMQACGGVSVESEPFGPAYIPAQPVEEVPALPAQTRIGG